MATKYSTPDYIDQLILLLIEAGGCQCWYLAEVFGISRPAITQRVLTLVDYGLIVSTNKQKEKDKRNYVLTTLGKEIVIIDKVQFQITMLKIKPQVA